MKNMTANEIAEALGVKKLDAAGFLRTLAGAGIIQTAGTRSSGRGKPSHLYAVPERLEIDLPFAVESEAEASAEAEAEASVEAEASAETADEEAAEVETA